MVEFESNLSPGEISPEDFSDATGNNYIPAINDIGIPETT
jgi:hypothetical protein